MQSQSHRRHVRYRTLLVVIIALTAQLNSVSVNFEVLTSQQVQSDSLSVR